MNLNETIQHAQNNGTGPVQAEPMSAELISDVARGLTGAQLLGYRITGERSGKYSDADKARAIRMVVREGCRHDDVAAALGVSASAISLWVAKWRQQKSESAQGARTARASATPRAQKSEHPASQDVDQLKAQLAAVTAERDLLLRLIEKGKSEMSIEEVFSLIRLMKRGEA